MNWADWLNDICILGVMDIHCSYQNLLCWAGIVWHRLSANQIGRYFKLKKLKNCMRYRVDFLPPLKLQKIYYFELCWKILLANQFVGVFTSDLFDLLILGVHCHILLVKLCYCFCLFLSLIMNVFSFWSSQKLLHTRSLVFDFNWIFRKKGLALQSIRLKKGKVSLSRHRLSHLPQGSRSIGHL